MPKHTRHSTRANCSSFFAVGVSEGVESARVDRMELGSIFVIQEANWMGWPRAFLG